MDAKKQVMEFERILQKTLQAYRLRLNMMQKRNQILSEIQKNGINQSYVNSLVSILRYEKKLIKIILTEDNIGRNNINIAIHTLKKIRKEPNILEELKRKNVDYKELKDATDLTLTILYKMAKEIYHIKKRIALEEALLENTNVKGFRKYLNIWKSEVNKEEKFRKFITRKKSTKVAGALSATGFVVAILGLIAIPAGIAGGVVAFSLGVGVACGNFVSVLQGVAGENQRRIDFDSNKILQSLKAAY